MMGKTLRTMLTAAGIVLAASTAGCTAFLNGEYDAEKQAAHNVSQRQKWMSCNLKLPHLTIKDSEPYCWKVQNYYGPITTNGVKN